MAEILTFVPPPPPPTMEPNAEVIAQLELLLDLAKQGAVTSLAYVAIGDPTQAPATGCAGPHRNALIAGALMLTDEVSWHRIS